MVDISIAYFGAKILLFRIIFLQKGDFLKTPAHRTKLPAVLSATRADNQIPQHHLPHLHDAYEIMLILSNGVSCRLGEETIPVARGSLMLFNSADLHGILSENNAPVTRYVVYFQPQFIAHLSTRRTQLLECFYLRPAPHPQLLPLNEAQLQDCIALLDALVAATHETMDTYGQDVRCQMQLAALLLFVNARYRDRHQLSSSAPEMAVIYDIVHYIHQHLDEKITLGTLAAQFLRSERDLSRAFHAALGTSLSEYVVKCRLARATDALSQGMRVEEVCERVGFQNLSHFSRTFKQHIGISPKQYALRHSTDK